MKLHIDGKESTYVAIEASKREPIRVEAAEDGVPAELAGAQVQVFQIFKFFKRASKIKDLAFSDSRRGAAPPVSNNSGLPQ